MIGNYKNKPPTILVTLFLCFFLYSQCFADDSRTVTLQAKLNSLHDDDASRLPLLLELAAATLYQQPALAEDYALKALSLTQQVNDKYSQASALRFLGMANMYEGNNDEAFARLTQALNVAQTLGDVHLLSICHRSLGVYYELIVDYDSALKFYIDAMKFARQSDDISDVAMVLNNLGNVLNSQGDYDDAIDYFMQAVTIHESINNLDMAMNAKIGLGTSYLKLQQYEQARQIFNNVLTNDIQILDFTYSEASVNLAHVYRALGMNEEAIELYTHIIDDTRAGSYPQALAAAYLGLASLYTELERFDQALLLYRVGISKVKNKTSVESEIELYENLALLEIRLGKYEDAAKTQAEYIARRNAVAPVTHAGIIKQLESQLKTERELTQLQDTLLQRERMAQHSSLFLLMSVIVSLLCLVLFLTLRLRQQKLLKLEQTNESLLVDSETDPLTRIGNRRFLERKLSSIHSTDTEFAVLLLDVDHFKQLNDTFGHHVGDEVLVQLAILMKGLCRKEDVLARLGGEEFIILLSNTDKASALTFAERVRDVVESNVFKAKARVTVSVGLTVGNAANTDFNTLYQQADSVLYQAKCDGRNRVCAY